MESWKKANIKNVVMKNLGEGVTSFESADGEEIVDVHPDEYYSKPDVEKIINLTIKLMERSYIISSTEVKE